MIHPKLPGQSDVDPDEFKISATLTRLTDAIHCSKGLDENTRKKLLQRIAVTRQTLRSPKMRGLENEEWLQSLEFETGIIEERGFTKGMIKRLINILKF